MVQQPSYWKVLTRRKVLSTEGHETESKLNRVLGLYDLTALGVGSTLGAGVYVLAGQIAKEQAGPSVMLSFAIAALASLLAGVCYAEFGARVPKAGSAYVYSYVCIGEFAAFVIGWNLILEYVIGTAAVCRGISLYLDTLINDTLKNTFAEVSPMNVSFLGTYFDWFAFSLVVIFGVALAFGVETSALANNFCTCLNISILLFVIIAGSIKANFANWSIDVSTVNATDVDSDLGEGGFFPFGFAGTLRGAATCFFGFVGFDCIATTGEEVRNPRKNIPRSILLSLLVIFLCYFGVSTVLTLMVPYYNQDPNAPLPYAFKEVGWNFAMWIVSVGGLIGLLASLFGALFPLPRVMYSMAEDGLLFHFLGKINPRFQVPVNGSIFAAVMTALIAGLFDLNQLVNLLSIGTLLAYSVVAISVTILRYMDNSSENGSKTNSNGTLSNGNGHTNGSTVNNHQPSTETTLLTSQDVERLTCQAIFVQLFNCQRLQTPNVLSTRIVGSLITAFCVLCVGIGLIFMEAFDALITNQVWVLVLLGILLALTGLVLLAICLQPRENFTPRIKVFRVPFVPIVPAVSIFINIYLMLQLDAMTWIRFGIWMIIGVPMFVACYCMYDLKSKRSPSRVAFLNALKAGARGEELANYDDDDDDDDRAAANGGYLKQGIEAPSLTKTNGKLTVPQNQLTLKSLDEIVKMSDVGEDLIEMRHPNGKVFYVEDNRSNASTLERRGGGSNGGSAANNNGLNGANGNGAEAADEEKSVIALLDDVLQGEDDGGALHTPISMHDYSRKFSVDSEMLPSFIETTIVATVHSSSDSSEHDLDDVPEEENEEQAAETVECLGPLASLELRNECARIAENLIDDIFKSQAVQQILKENAENMEKLALAESTESSSLKRKVSQASMQSAQSIQDPMHSMDFKEKLSKLIMQAPAKQPTPVLRNTAAEANDSPAVRPKLKHSKSEADVRKLVLKAIEERGLLLDENGNAIKRSGIEAAANDASDSNNNNNNNSIPKPPKFDPILYKTVNSSFTANKTRPSLNKSLLLQPEERRTKIPSDIEAIAPLKDDANVPFKTKLEAILKRGPSHRSQRRPDVEMRVQTAPRAKTMIEIGRQSMERSSITEESTPRYQIYDSGATNVSAEPILINSGGTNVRAEPILINTRMSLKPISNRPIKS